MGSVGKRIKEMRNTIGMSQVEFADKIGVSKQTLYKYENDIITNIPSDKIEAAAQLCGISPAALMGWEDVKPKSDMQKLSPREYTHLSVYRSLSDPGKDRVDSYTEKVKSLEADEADQNVVETFQKRLVARNGNKNLSPSDMKKILEILDNQ